MDRINEMLDRIQELADSDISDLEGQIISEFETVEQEELSEAKVSTLTALADALESVRAESTRRSEALATLQRAEAEASARVKGASSTEPLKSQTNENDQTDAVAGDVEVPAPPGENPTAQPDEALETDANGNPVRKKVPTAASVDEETAVVDQPVEAEAAVAETVETPAAETELAVEENTTAAEVAPETEASTAEETENTPETTQEAAVTAAADQSPVIQAPDDRRPNPKPVSVAITAGADIPNVTAGSSFVDMGQVAEAFDKRLFAMRRVTGGDGEQHIVASLHYDYPTDRVLNAGDDAGNATKIEKVASPQAIMASGGFCAPLEQRYDFFELAGSTERPVRDSLAKFQADRGGIRYASSPRLRGGATDYFAATSVWTQAMDLAPGNYNAGTGNLKPCIPVDCPPQIEARTEAVTLCLQFGNLMTRAYPELIKRHNELALIAHAREAEEGLLAKIEAAGTAMTSPRVLGAARDFFSTLEAAAVALRYRHRMNQNTPLRVIAPFWLLNLIRGDLVRQMPGDGPDFTFDLNEARIQGWFRSRNINVTWSMDGSAALGANLAAGVVADIPETVEWDLFPEGTFLFLDGGTLDLGIIRDSSLVATNDYKTFVETFEGLAKIGPESLHVTSQLEMVGAAQALVDAGGLTTALTD